MNLNFTFVSLLLTACATPHYPDSPVQGPTDFQPLAPATLAGTSWKVVSVNGHAAFAGGTIRFRDQAFEAHFGCNWITGAYRQDANAFRPSNTNSTEQACVLEPSPPVPVMTYEAWGFAILSQDARVERAGPNVVELNNGRGSIRLEPLP